MKCETNARNLPKYPHRVWHLLVIALLRSLDMGQKILATITVSRQLSYSHQKYVGSGSFRAEERVEDLPVAPSISVLVYT